MLKNKFYRTLLVASITGSLIISTGVVAFASSSKSTTTPKTAIGQKSPGEHNGQRNGFMQKGDMQGVNPLVSVLKSQVTAGTITQAESDAITSFIKTKETAEKAKMAAEKNKLQAMTDAERQTYMEANRPVRENIIAELVTAKLLTQDQANKIQAAMPLGKEQGGQFGRKEKGMHEGNGLAANLKTQVAAKVITQADSDKVTAFLKTKEDAEKVARAAEKAKFDAMTPAQKTADMAAKKAARAAEEAKFEAMTPEQKTAAMAAKKAAHKDIFTELVTANILTQNQVDKIKASMPQKFQKENWHGQKPVGAPTNTANDTNE